MREKARSRTCPRVLTARVLASPGTPSTRRWPRQSSATIIRSIRPFWPTITFLTSRTAFWTCSDSSRTVSFSLATSTSVWAIVRRSLRFSRFGRRRAAERLGRTGRARGRGRPLTEVADLALEKGPSPLELGHVSPRQRGHRLPGRGRELRLAERLQLFLDLAHLARDALQAPHVRGVEGGEQHLDSRSRRHNRITLACAPAACQDRGYTGSITWRGSVFDGEEPPLQGRHPRLRPCRPHRRALRVAGGAHAARRGGRRRGGPHGRGRRPAHDDDRRRQLPRLPEGDPRPRPHGGHAEAGRALRHRVRHWRGEV